MINKYKYILNQIVFLLIFPIRLLAADQPAVEAPKLKWKGDLRLRYEKNYLNENSPSVYDLERIMFRPGASTALSPTADVEFRITTGTGRTSTNQTLGDSNNGFKNYSIGLDRAFFNWRPLDRINFYGGRIKNTHFAAGGNDMVFDSDINFDGTAIHYTHPIDEIELFGNTAAYWVNKTTTAGKSDNVLFVGQVGIKHKLEVLSWSFGASIYQFTHSAKQSALDGSTTSPNFKGNTKSGTGASAVYAYDYHLMDFGAEVGFDLGIFPTMIFAEYVKNNGTESSDRFGYIGGFKIGKAKKKGDMQLGYDYRKIKSDAIIGAFTDADFLVGSGTNGYGHRLKLSYMIEDYIQAGLNGCYGKVGIAAGDTESKRAKYQIDLSFFF